MKNTIHFVYTYDFISYDVIVFAVYLIGKHFLFLDSIFIKVYVPYRIFDSSIKFATQKQDNFLVKIYNKLR